MFEEGSSNVANHELTTNTAPEPLTLEALHQKVDTLTAIIMQQQKMLQQQQESLNAMQSALTVQQEESDVNLARLDPEKLLTYLNTQEPSSALFSRWLLENQRKGLPFAHSLLWSIGDRRGLDYSELSRQLLLLIKKLPQAERAQFLEHMSSNNEMLEQYVFLYGNEKHFNVYVDCLAPATVLTVKHDEDIIFQQPKLFSLMLNRLEDIYTKEELLAFYQRQDNKLKTIGHFIDWYDSEWRVEYLRVLTTFSKTNQLNTLMLQDNANRRICPSICIDKESTNAYFTAIDIFEVTEQLDLLTCTAFNSLIGSKIITLLNQLSDEELKDYLPKVNLANIGFVLMEYSSKASLEQKADFLKLIMKLSKDEQYKLLIQEKEGSSSLLELCLKNNLVIGVLVMIVGFKPEAQVKLFKSEAFYEHFISRSFQPDSVLSKEKRRDLIAYLAILEELEPATKLMVLDFENKSTKSLNKLIEYFCQKNQSPNLIVAYFLCLGNNKLPVSLNKSSQQAVVDIIKKMPDKEKIKICALALKKGSALNQYLSVKSTFSSLFCLPETKRPETYLEQLQVLLPKQPLAGCSASSSNPTYEEASMERQPLMIDFGKDEQEEADSNLRHRTGFVSSI